MLLALAFGIGCVYRTGRRVLTDLTDTMNNAAGAYLGLRVAYIFAYIGITRQKYSYLRSMIWAISTGVLFRLFWKAGNKLTAQG